MATFPFFLFSFIKSSSGFPLVFPTNSVIVKTVSLTLPRIDDNIKLFRAICMKHNFERDVNVIKAPVLPYSK